MEDRINDEANLKGKIAKLVLLIFIFILLIASSYAFFGIIIPGKSQYIKAGTLKVKLDDKFSDGILLQNAIPISDTKGMETTAYTFTVENEGSKRVKYKIYLDDIALEEDKQRLPDKFVKYSLIKNDNNTTALLSTTGTNLNRVIDSGTIQRKTKNTYTLRVWMDKTADMDVMGNVFFAKIRVAVEQDNPIYTNENIQAVYAYNPSTCITGEEETCQMIPLGGATKVDSGTIIKYEVNDSTIKYFYVLHDDGETLTMQQRENTIYATPWNTNNDSRRGPTAVLEKLETATKDWSNVMNQNYNMGTTIFGTADNGFSGCKEYNQCNYNHYTLSKTNVKARMITMQEATALNCTTSPKSCPIWMNNYLYYSTSSGGTKNDNFAEDGKTRNYGYWTMSTLVDGSTGRAWNVRQHGMVVSSHVTTYTNSGARAVVVISK